MNKRIRNKVYNRAISKLDAHRKPDDKRTYLQIEQKCHILSNLEKNVFYGTQHRFCNLTDKIIDELKSEGQW